ncbi:Hypothetical predicted protein, partial [Paramuricea clavata]
MGKLLNYLCIFSVLFAVSLSLRDNNTSVKKTTEGEAEGWSWPGWGQVFGGRQASVFLTDVYNYLREAVWNYGTLKFVVWNRTPNELNEGKWKAKHLAVEAPVPLFIESKKRPVVVSSHYHQRLTWNNPHSLWVSYRISENSRCRICIYGKLEYGWFHFKSPPKLKYAVYITDENDCDEDKKLKSIIFVHENYQNGYNYSKQNGVTAKSAFETHGLNHVLNVYILDFHVEEKKEKQERNKESSSNINMQQQQGTEKIEKNNQSKTKQFVVFYTYQTGGIRTCDVEAKFIKVNTSETPGFQIFSVFYKTCVVVNGSDYVTVGKCDTEKVGQRWMWINDDLLLHKSTRKCLAVDGDIIEHEKLKVLPCNDSSPKQRWTCTRDVLRLVMNIWMFMNYARDGESHLITSDQASLRDHLNIYQTESTLCTAKPGYQRFQIYSKAFNLCASVDANDYVLAQTCDHDLFSPLQAWQWINSRQLRHEYTGKCLDIVNGIAIGNRIRIRTCNSTSKSQQWACDGLLFEVGGTKIKMNYGHVDKPHILAYNIYLRGPYSRWIIYQTPDSSLCSINPYNDLFSKKILNITTVALKAFCSIECAKEQRCKAYIFLEFKKSENCLLSSDPDGNQSIPYHGVNFVKLSNDQ